MTVNITEVFRLHPECLTSTCANSFPKKATFAAQYIRYVRRVEDSMKLNELRGPAIIISASGMCESGRILHHLRNNCEERATPFSSSASRRSTRSDAASSSAKEIKIFGVKRPLNADVQVLNDPAPMRVPELIAFGQRFKDCAQHLLWSTAKKKDGRAKIHARIQRPNQRHHSKGRRAGRI